MIVACYAIVLIVFIMSFLMVRSTKKSGWGIGLLPISLVPMGHIFAPKLSTFISNSFSIRSLIAWIFIDLIFLGVACLCMGLISFKIKNLRIRTSYLVVCVGFSVILCCVLISDIIPIF